MDVQIPPKVFPILFLPPGGLHPPAAVLSIRPMNLSSARYYFWFYGYPMPQAEEGARS